MIFKWLPRNTVKSLETKTSSKTEMTRATLAAFSSATGAVGALILLYVIGEAQEAFEKD